MAPVAEVGVSSFTQVVEPLNGHTKVAFLSPTEYALVPPVTQDGSSVPLFELTPSVPLNPFPELSVTVCPVPSSNFQFAIRLFQYASAVVTFRFILSVISLAVSARFHNLTSSIFPVTNCDTPPLDPITFIVF